MSMTNVMPVPQGKKAPEGGESGRPVTGEPLLEAVHLKKSFGAVQALRGATLTCRAGEVTALVGDNGAGKSTLIKCIAGIHPIDDGEDLESVESEAEFKLIGIRAEDGNPTEESSGDGIVPYFALTPIGVTEENIQDTVIADGFRTKEEVCTGDTAQTEFCRS